MDENKLTWGIVVVQLNFFVRFSKETSAWKYHFDLVWPLGVLIWFLVHEFVVTIDSSWSKILNQRFVPSVLKIKLSSFAKWAYWDLSLQMCNIGSISFDCYIQFSAKRSQYITITKKPSEAIYKWLHVLLNKMC